MSDDFTANTSTTGSVAVGDAATGEIGSSGDRDWFAVDLVAGRTYVIDLRGRPTGDGTLSDPYLRGIHDADGNLISGTTNDDGGDGYNSRLTFTASESGTYYIAAGAYSGRGTYELEVTERVSDDTRDGAKNLGDITDLGGPRFPNASLDGDGDRIDYFRFTLTESKEVGLGLRQQDVDADLFLEDAEGNVLYSSTVDGTTNEAINETLLAGTYYVRVDAQEAGDNQFKLRYGVSAPDPDEVTRLEQQQQGGTNEAPTFGQQSYSFDLAENADGSTNRVALGTVSATDPENATMIYSIAGGNDADLFEIDSATGALIYTGSGEDYESGTTSYALTVRVSDGSLHNDVTVTVNTNDVAEAPAFAEASYAFDVAENADGSTDRVALGTVSATDPEGTTLTYSIAGGNDADLFEIDSATGVLSYKGSGEDFESETTSYELTVRASDGNLYTDVTVAVSVTDVEESDDTGDGARDLGNITDLNGAQFPNASLDGDGDRIDYFKFNLTEARKVGLGLRQQDSDADLFLEDAQGNVLYNSTKDGTANEWISQTLVAGTYYVRVEAQEQGDNDFKLRYGVSEADPNAAPAFAAATFAFDLAENADGSANRVALGTVTATDPEAATVTYSIESGNDAGLFEIDSSTGALAYKGTGEDYESGTTSYELTVRASDGSQHSDVSVIVNVSDVEETVQQSLPSVSEPDRSDLPEDTSTTGRVAVGGVATGEIQSANDQDWFAVELAAGQTYQIEVRGRSTGDGWLPDPYLRGIHDAEGNLIAGTTNDDGGEGYNSRLTFTATENGAHYIAAGAYSGQGTYVVEVVEDDFAQSTETTGSVEVGGTASGEIHRASDRDWFAVELEAGKAYQIDLSGARSGGGTLNLPHLRGVYDADGSQIPGVYHPRAFWGFQNQHNRLREGISSVDIQMFREEDSQAFFTPDEDGTYYLELGNFDFSSTGTYTVGMTEIEDDFLRTVDTTGTVDVGGTATGDIQYANDRDWLGVDLELASSTTCK